MGDLDKAHPCPHCGDIEPLTKDRKLNPVIPEEFQYDFSKGINDPKNRPKPINYEQIYGNSSSLPKTSDLVGKLSDLGITASQKRVSQNIPLEYLFPSLPNVTLDPASLKLYFQLSVEFQIILNNASSYHEGVQKWSLLLPDRLQEYGLTEDVWNGISRLGDRDPLIQAELTKILQRLFQQKR